jgi:transcriptional regulator of acetoin/glycerol metabolism
MTLSDQNENLGSSMLTKSTDTTLRKARHLLVERGELPPPELLGATVLQSWSRCLNAGLVPIGDPPDAPCLEGYEFARAADRQHLLIAHARPVMEYLYSQTRDSGSMVILADDCGILLETMGDTDFLSRAERVALMQGASWHEQHRGTNGIGTALAEEAPVAVHGFEHFLERHGFLSCAAAPIASPNGRFQGVLNISGDYRTRPPHTFGFVRAAAQMIENRLFNALHGDALRLRFHPLAEGIGTIAEGKVALSEDGWIVGANQAALALLGLSPSDLGATPVAHVLQVYLKDLVHWGLQRGREPMPVMRHTGECLFVRVELGRKTFQSFVPREPEAKDDALSVLDTGDAQMKTAIHKARRLIGKSIALLLCGESGVGKELFANAFHNAGLRQEKPFVAVNCATLPESLIETELFGYVPGTFTGALKEGSPGRIRSADGGTLFLDEIGDMLLAQQARLLRVLQEREVVPVGGIKPVPVDFDLVCATHRDLKAEMEAGRFREDLYYRINGFNLKLPALRERTDFGVLVARMLHEMAPDLHAMLDDNVAAAFATYAWPGNLRQLVNVLRTATALLDEGENIIGWQHLPDDLVEELLTNRSTAASPDTAENLKELSEAAVARVIAASHGNMSEAARRLGISRNTLYRRVK